MQSDDDALTTTGNKCPRRPPLNRTMTVMCRSSFVPGISSAFVNCGVGTKKLANLLAFDFALDTDTIIGPAMDKAKVHLLKMHENFGIPY